MRDFNNFIKTPRIFNGKKSSPDSPSPQTQRPIFNRENYNLNIIKREGRA
ncbi:hypothetical protein MROS_0567 [Melioribacter roseus P3M-2]|uniref:Uncharacterized protein n=1 Tax=Melioribacter roseus (strain DSM 23840 / JCM 17771 / VKM B-2668 / P3M-2) TaxID=1191523 RepID=I6Z3T9_MELRP|nr:hypothetical protein MROS_0567 [Melioribacter roseus P3M-2]